MVYILQVKLLKCLSLLYKVRHHIEKVSMLARQNSDTWLSLFCEHGVDNINSNAQKYAYHWCQNKEHGNVLIKIILLITLLTYSSYRSKNEKNKWKHTVCMKTCSAFEKGFQTAKIILCKMHAISGWSTEMCHLNTMQDACNKWMKYRNVPSKHNIRCMK